MENMTKDEIRRQVASLRQGLDQSRQERMDRELFEKLEVLEPLKQAQYVYLYVSLPGEAGTKKMLSCLWDRGVRTAVPRVQGRDMSFYYIRSFEDLEAGCMGILEPRASCPRAGEKNAPMVIPGVAFDLAGHRVGYGGGYYDRFLAAEPEHLKIGLAYGFQIYESVPWEPHDCAVDIVVAGGEKREE